MQVIKQFSHPTLTYTRHKRTLTGDTICTGYPIIILRETSVARYHKNTEISKMQNYNAQYEKCCSDQEWRFGDKKIRRKRVTILASRWIAQ